MNHSASFNNAKVSATRNRTRSGPALNTGWGHLTSPYWLQIVNSWPKTIKTPYVTYFPLPKAANFSYVNKATGQLATFPPFTSIRFDQRAGDRHPDCL